MWKFKCEKTNARNFSLSNFRKETEPNRPFLIYPPYKLIPIASRTQQKSQGITAAGAPNAITEKNKAP